MLIIANWKAYVEDIEKAKLLFSLSKKFVKDHAHQIVLAPPAPLLGTLTAGNKSKIEFAAQDVSITTGGALTGESTAAAYVAAGATYAIIGHSERRALGDTETAVAQKLSRALAHGLIPILCVGERERDTDGRYLSFLREQLTNALETISPKERSKIIVAYEPIWAINKTAALAISVDDLAEMTLYIRKVLAELLPGKSSSKAKVIYGGSVEPDNVRALAAGTSVDGFLIGHDSVDPDMFTKLVKQLS